MYNRGTKYLNSGKYSKALSFYKKEPLDFKEKYLNMGTCYRGLEDNTLAFKYYTLANSASVPYADGSYAAAYPLALNNLGMLKYGAGDVLGASVLYKEALGIDPLYYETLWNLSHCMLRSGFNGLDVDWTTAWKLYEYRFKRANPVGLNNSLPMWDLVSCGDCIVVLAEQGLGDKIMFGRYVHLLRQSFKRVVVQCHPSLDCLFSDFEICRSTEGFSLDTVAIPICSLPLKYFSSHPSERWLDGKFNGVKLDGKNIGVVWAGSTTHSNNHNRSCPSSYFAGLADLGTLHSLNPAAPAVRGIMPCVSSSWAETAAKCLSLDYVVTVDTSIVHLCGTLGVKCIMIQPIYEIDFRWGDGSITYWYDSVEIVNERSWSSAFARVREICTKL